MSARCLVIGGTGTVGRAVCAALAQRGARIAFTYHTARQRAAELRDAVGAWSCALDLTRAGEVGLAVGLAADAFEGLDALVCCAGVGVTAPLDAQGHQALDGVGEDAWDRMLDVNVKGAFFACRAARAALARAGGGNIVLLGSIDGVKLVPSPAHYAAAHGALAGMTRALAKELGGENIRVNMVASGPLDEGMARSVPPHLTEEYLKHSALRRLGKPAEVAAVIAWLAVENTYLTGRAIAVDGGL